MSWSAAGGWPGGLGDDAGDKDSRQLDHYDGA